MVFRGYESGGSEFLRDPFARFLEIDAALESGRALLGDLPSQRLAAVSLVLTPLDAAEIAAQVRSMTARFAERLPWFLTVEYPLQLLFAALLLRHGDSPELLIEEAERVRDRMASLGMRWAPSYQLIATLAMRVHGGKARIPDAQISRMRDIYEAMKVHHWWLTGPDDFPTCALLTTRQGTPKALAGRAHDIYQGLREDFGAGPSDSLQTASNILALADAPPRDLSRRFATLAEGFKAAGFRVGQGEFDEIATLCFLPRSITSIVEGVVEHRQRLREHVKWYEQVHTFNFAANLTFVHAIGNDPLLSPLADVKALLDMKWILLQQA